MGRGEDAALRLACVEVAAAPGGDDAHRATVAESVSGTSARDVPRASPRKMHASLPSMTRKLNGLSASALRAHSRLLPACVTWVRV